MSTHRPRLLQRLSAFVAAGALTAGGLAFTASPASASEETIDNATFTWGVSGYAQDGIFGPWNFKDFTGDAEFLEGSVVNSPLNPDPQTEYTVDPVPATSFPTSKNGRQPNAVKFTGGEGTIDRVTGEADLDWTGSYTVNAYPAMYNAPDEIYEDPSLTVNADGSGVLTAHFTIGEGVSMSDPDTTLPEQDFGRLTIATFDAGSLSNKTIRGYRVTPDFQGVTNGVEGQATTCVSPSVWGSWPTPYIDALNSHESGRSVLPHFYTTGCGGRNDTKPALPFDVKFPTSSGEVSVSKTVFDNNDTESVTVTGEGFNPALSAGNGQPPFAGKSSGVYIAFGRFQDVWDPAAGAPSGSRALADDPANRNGVSVKWAVPAASFPGSPAQSPSAPSYTELKADGSFKVTLQIKKEWISAATGNWGIYTYRGGNPAVTEYATFTPISFVDKEESSVTLDHAAYTGTEGDAIPVEASVSNTSGDAQGDVELAYTPDGGSSSVVVDEGTLDENGDVELELPGTLEAGEGDLVVNYLGDDSSKASSSASAAVTVEEGPQATEVSVSGVGETSVFGAARTATVTVSGDDATPTGDVTVKIGETTIGTGTLVEGVATVALPRTTAVGTHTVVYSYAGDSDSEPSELSTTLTINKSKVKVTRSATTKPTTKKTGKTTVTVKSVTAGGPTVTGKVVLTFKKSGKKTQTVTKTLTWGKAVAKIPKLSKGTWKVYVKYLGSSSYGYTATTASGSFTVTK